MTVSALIVAISLTILYAAINRTGSSDVAILCILAALALTTIDVVYVSRGTILPIYLVDAAVEIPLILFWVYWLATRKREIPT